MTAQEETIDIKINAENGYSILEEQEKHFAKSDVDIKNECATYEDNTDQANVRLEEFVKYFVKEFEAKLHAYHLISEGETKKAGKFSDAFSEKIGQGVGGAVGGFVGFLIGSPVAGVNFGATVGKAEGGKLGSKIGSQQHKKKVTNLLDLIDLSQKDKTNYRQVLVEAGCDVFQSFEMQFMRVTTDEGPKKAMQQLAKDATNRAINYYTHKKDALITEGVVLGESKIEPVLGVLPIAASKIKTPGFEISYKYKSSEEKWYTASLYEKVGLVIEGQTPREITSYYEKKDGTSRVDKYGYRRLFTSEKWNKLKDKYRSDIAKNGQLKDYQYILNSKDLKQKSKDILKKINLDDKGLVEERLTKILEEVKVDIIEEVNLLKKQSNKEDRKLLAKLETKLKSLKVDEYLEEFKQYFKESKQELHKIAKSLKASREESKENFNNLSQKQDIHHDDNKREHRKTQEVVERIECKIDTIVPRKDQNKDPVWFNIREPVKSFTGREDKLQELHRKLNSKSGQVVISQTTVITGLGGIGKSELARKYAYDHGKDYDGNVIWINAEKQEDLIKNIQELASDLKVPISKNRFTGEIDMKSTTQSVYKYFKSTKSLFIFDNAEEYNDINFFLPYSLPSNNKKPHILITSRNRDWEVGEEGEIEEVPLGEFSPEEATEFIKKALVIKIQDNSRDEEIKQLAEELQYFPLALQQATACIKERRAILKTRASKSFEVNDYLTEFKEEVKKTDLLDFKSKHGNDRYIKTVFTTWKTTLKNIEQKEYSGKQALRILDFMAYLAPDKIPIERLFLKLVGNEKLMWSAVDLLNKYSMINLKEGISNIHRLVQEVTRIELKGQDKEEEVLRKALELIKSTNLAGEYTSHVVSILNYASQYDQLINDFYFDFIYGKEENTPLHLLATNGNKEAIERILTSMQSTIEKMKIEHYESSDLMERIKNHYNKVGYAPIHIAAFCGHKEIVKYFIEEQKVDAKLVSRNNLEQTPMMLATLLGHLNIVRYLVESKKDTDVNIPNRYGMYPIHSAAMSGNPDLVQFLIKNGANNLNILFMRVTPLYLTLNGIHGYTNNSKVVDILLDKDPTLVNRNELGITPLHRAVEEGDKKSTETLLRRGAIVNMKTFKIYFRERDIDNGKVFIEYNNSEPGLTSLHIAAQQDLLEIAKLLLEYGAIYNDVNIEGKTPLQVSKPKSDVEKLLNIIDKLFDAVKNGKEDEVCSLLQGKAPDELKAILNARNTDNKKFSSAGRLKSETLLHIAAQQNCLNITKHLLKYGAIYNATDELRNTPADVTEPGSDIEELFNAIDKLFQAVRDNKKDVVKSSLDGKEIDTLKAILNARNIDNNTLLYVATANGQRDIAELLAEKLRFVQSSGQQQEAKYQDSEVSTE